MASVQTVHAEIFPESMDVAADTDPDASPNTCKTTILDLNEDCWRAILDYIPEGQIVRSERVSRRWQAVVHRYLREAGVCFVPFSIYFKHHDVKILTKNRVFTIDFRNISSHSEMEDILAFLDKWGPCIVHTLSPSPEVFEKITECCPKLRSLAITMNTFRSAPLSQDQVEFAEKLERIVFIDYTCMERDAMMETLDKQRIRQKIDFRREIFHRPNMALRDISSTRDFWCNFRPTNLQSLTVRGMFDFRNFLATVDCFPALIDLNLQGDLQNVRVLLEKTPKLERLCMMRWNMEPDEAPENCCGCVCGLQKLKTLILWDCDVESRWLEAVLSDCPELQILELTTYIYELRFDWALHRQHDLKDPPIGAQALCSAVGRSLTALRIPCRRLQDSYVATLIEGCPKLTALDLRQCYGLSPKLLDMAAQASKGRQKPLLLFIGDTEAVTDYYNKMPELIVVPDFYELYVESLRPRQFI